MALASEITTFGIQVASHSDIWYQAFATRFHFLRFRSRPSTFRATGMPASLGIQVKMALAALQYSTASCLRPSRRTPVRCSVERQGWGMGSRDFCGGVGGKRSL